jgi:hypothetical protein
MIEQSLCHMPCSEFPADFAEITRIAGRKSLVVAKF